jgi:hypothetical protein
MKYLKGVKLGCNKRMEDLKVYSSSDFKIEFEYETSEETQLVLHQLNKASSNSNEYTLRLQIPNQVSHSFSGKMNLIH